MLRLIILCAYIDVVSTREFCILLLTIIISLISLANWWYQGKYIFAKVLAFQHISLFKCVSWPTVTLHLQFLRQFHAGDGEKAFFKQQRYTWVQKPCLQGEKKVPFWKHFRTAAIKNNCSLNQLRFLKWNNTLGQNCYDYWIFLRCSYYQI